MVQFKRLSLPSWCDYLGWDDKHDILGTAKAPVIPVVFGRDGWYYDRAKKRTWIEYQGVAYAYDDVGRFQYELETCYPHTLPREQAVSALHTLECEGMLSDRQRQSLRAWREWMYLRCIHTGYYKWPGWAKALKGH